MTTEHKHMTTEQVAKRLLELCRQGNVLDAQEELYAEDITCIEPAHGSAPTVNGKTAALEKGKQFAAMIEEVHGAQISEPVVAGNWFSISWTMEATLKGQGRQKLEEICVYQVKDGQIVSEQFFF